MFQLALLTTFALLPPHGTYEVRHDSVDVSYPKWDSLCGEQTEDRPSLAAESIVLLKHYDDASKFWLDGGELLHLGTDLCQGTNPSLAVVKSNPETNTEPNGNVVKSSTGKPPTSWTVTCRSKRAAQGTETTVHTITQEGSTVSLDYKRTTDIRVRRSRCITSVERSMSLARIDESKVESGTLAKKKTVSQTPIKYSMASIEADLEAELASLADERSGVRIVQQNTLDGIFEPVSAEYKIDGAPIERKAGRPIPLVGRGTQDTVYNRSLPAGSHSLEVILVYKVRKGGNTFRVQLRDTSFFDVVAGGPTTITVTAVDNESLWTEKTESAKINFHVRGGDSVVQSQK